MANRIATTESIPNESTLLIPKFPNLEREDGQYSKKSLILAEFGLLLKGSTPVILAYTLQNSLQTISVLIVGRSSPENLAAAAFSYMFAMCTAWLIGLGGTTALDTLASSSFTGSANKHDLGILLQRGFFVLGLFYVPVAILWALSEPVFLFLGQDPNLSRDSARFLTCLIPGGLGYIYFESMKKYLQAQGIMRPGTYVLLITSPVNAGLNYLFCYTLDIGLLGAPIATSISYWLSFALLVLYTCFIAGSECWGGWSRAAVQNIGTFARLAFLGVIHVGTEWWAFEIVALAAGRLGTIPLAAQSVIMTADQVLNTIPFGVGVAASTRVGNLLGARNAHGAARAAHTAAFVSILLGGIVLAVLMGTRHSFGRIFNDDDNVVRLTAEVLPYVALFQIADGLNGSCGGSLRGMGRQHIGALVNLISYYGGALPLGIWLAFHGWGLKGLWVGQCIALYLVGALEWAIVYLSNWDKEVDKAFQRMDVQARLEDGVVDTSVM
ncbi:MATE efflux family protein subfamily, putative [Talaromyces stipitatus ATCC 10500]|uniref:MATE efflux family protein subfamily, putative n=1 Tax=Talaromyces stipitatus (strain ATCC 10500 / CBS 375.48 / QM 6759 / NRRL 1006) TaxID=441959 RepID=B8M7H4_TALSN|nr:MATE efflux family protein subfamily, putative [Talaromyces stipitatus ATCC 10500]EED19527.1 MATE efflux family protein subfamily, putative [Talaromyces stipitatus ATCC 10500]